MDTLLEPQASYEAGRYTVTQQLPAAPINEFAMNFGTYKIGQWHAIQELIARNKQQESVS